MVGPGICARASDSNRSSTCGGVCLDGWVNVVYGASDSELRRLRLEQETVSHRIKEVRV